MKTGDIFIARIDRISNSENGIVATDNGIINVGPMPREAAGKKIKGVIQEINRLTSFALCVSEEYLTLNYLSWAIERFVPELKDTYIQSKKMVCKVERISNGDNPIINDPRYPEEILVYGSTENVESGDILKISLKDSNLEKSGIHRADLLSRIERTKIYEQKMKEWGEKSKEELGINEIREKEVDILININNSDTIISDPDSTSQSMSPEELESLRKQAKKESVESASKVSATQTQSTQQYRRSQEVRDYVMARADGVCEGCQESAPFISKTGEPYLHAHHIHELSEGGSDTPETVIALCPNCHYRVHHGVDGDEYNQQLLERIRSIETT